MTYSLKQWLRSTWSRLCPLDESKRKTDAQAAEEFVSRLGHAVAKRIGISHSRVRYFNDSRYWLANREEGWTFSPGDGLSSRELHASPLNLLQRSEDGSFLVGIAVTTRRFELALIPSCMGVVFKLRQSANGRFIVEDSIGTFTQGRKMDASLYRRIFYWNEANITEFVASFGE